MMSVIVLRLQGLKTEAGIKDIRRFFANLHIPEGAVKIVGGHLGEAFIVFNKEEDAQHAVQQSGSLLKGSPVTLHISSIAEMNRKMHLNLHSLTLLPALVPEIEPFSPLAVPSADSGADCLTDVAAKVQGPEPKLLGEHNKLEVSAPGTSIRVDSTAVAVEELRRPEDTSSPTPGYVRLFGLPDTVTRLEICRFFQGLAVRQVILNVKLGLRYGCLVKFSHAGDADHALWFNNQKLDSSLVEVRGASEEMWSYAVKQCQNPSYDPLENPVYRPKFQRELPPHTIQQDQPPLNSKERSLERPNQSCRNQKLISEPNKDGELPRTCARKCSEDQSLSPKRPRTCESVSPTVENTSGQKPTPENN
ncbi:hypothetical protein UPYG_G00155840 [Umbra pygmaea]|uniref:RRM domain-containing protein n=1 Tax=Umbra pygmaea TaxID=75934 RepID=A0ABD0WYC7_UMBPY